MLPLRALLPRLRRRRRPRRVRLARPRLFRPRTRTACSRTSSAATWSRSARPASSPTRPLEAHYTRKWDLQIGAVGLRRIARVGCNTIPGERYGTCAASATAINGEVNGYFLCDRGRFGYEFVNSDRRIRQPSLAARRPTARDGRRRRRRSARRVRSCRRRQASIGIGSPRASLEANFALRALVGADRFYRGVSRRRAATDSHSMLEILRDGPARAASLHEIEQCRCGARARRGRHQHRAACWPCACARRCASKPHGDARTKLQIPRLARCRRARRGAGREGSALHRDAATRRGSTTSRRDVPRRTRRYRAARLRRGARARRQRARRYADLPRRRRARCARDRRRAARRAKRPLDRLRHRAAAATAVIQAAANVAWALCTQPAAPRALLSPCPSATVSALGAARRRHARSRIRGASSSGTAETLIVLENDLYRRARRETLSSRFSTLRGTSSCSITSMTDTARSAERRAARRRLRRSRRHVRQQRRPRATLLPGLRARRATFRKAGAGCAMRDGCCGRPARPRGADLDDIIAALRRRRCPRSAAIRERRAAGATSASHGRRSRAQPHRYSGRTAMHANVSVHEPKPPDDPDTRAGFSMEGYHGPAAVRADSPFLGAGLELGAGRQQVSARGRRPAARRRSRRPPDRAAGRTRHRAISAASRRRSRRSAASGCVVPLLPHLRLRGTERARARRSPSCADALRRAEPRRRRASRRRRTATQSTLHVGGDDASSCRQSASRCRRASPGVPVGLPGLPAADGLPHREARLGRVATASARRRHDELVSASRSSSASCSSCSIVARRTDLARAAAARASGRTATARTGSARSACCRSSPT